MCKCVCVCVCLYVYVLGCVEGMTHPGLAHKRARHNMTGRVRMRKRRRKPSLAERAPPIKGPRRKPMEEAPVGVWVWVWVWVCLRE